MTCGGYASPAVICPVCRAGADFYFKKNDYALFKCPDCGFVFVCPLPDNTARIYSEDYFNGATQGFGYANYGDDKVAMLPFFVKALETVESFIPKKGALLDVGAATGFFMRLAKNRGWEATGLELSPYAARQACRIGLDVREGTLESSLLPAGHFDAVTMIDLIEHVAHPNEVLTAARRILRPGGILFINTPDTASLWAKIFGAGWHAYCPPEHLSYFNRGNMTRLLKEHSFEIVSSGKIAKRFTPAYVFSMLGRWQNSPLWVRVGKAVNGSLLNRIPLPVNIRDNFFVVARRPMTQV